MPGDSAAWRSAVTGRRLPDGDHGVADAQPGDYWKGSHGMFEARAPSGEFGLIRTHRVIEHDDRTITVSPSLVFHGADGWHGWLERGIWRAC